MTWQTGFIQSEDVKIHYYRQGAGVPLIMVHGFSDSGACWQALAQHFVDVYDVILIDARAHGHSEASLVSNGNPAQARDVANLITALGLDRPIVMGHSMGANTTLQVAVDLGDQIRAAILEDPPFIMQEPEQSAARVEEIRQGMMRWLGEMQGMPLEQLVMRCIKENPTWRAEELVAWSESKQQFATKAQHFGPRHFNPWQDLLKSLTAPSLLIVSDPARGGLVTAEAAALARSLSSSIQVGLIRDAGHCIRRESPVAYMKMVRGFLSEK